MRQGQQNRRGRGRNRKSQNPLTRSFESNGPDVKIRGTPSHIAEKYMSLARDALSSGDRVLAENYLQHAEHYNRIIMAYREQQSQFGEGGHQGGQQRGRDQNDFDDDGDDDLPELGSNGHSDAFARGQGPQPSIFDDGEGGAPERPARRFNGSQSHGGGQGSQGGGHGGREDQRRRRDEGGARQERQEPRGGFAPEARAEAASEAQGEQRPRRRERFAQRDDQPEFLRRPIRKPRRAATEDGEAEGDDASDGTVSDNTSA